MAVSYKVTEKQEVDNQLKFMAEEFDEEIERMSLKQRLRPEELRLVGLVQPKKGKNKVGASRLKVVQANVSLNN